METLSEFAVRVARETGAGEDSPEWWIERKAAKITVVAKAFCHYGNGGCSVNSCCSQSWRCRDAAEAGAHVYFGTATRGISEEKNANQ